MQDFLDKIIPGEELLDSDGEIPSKKPKLASSEEKVIEPTQQNLVEETSQEKPSDNSAEEEKPLAVKVPKLSFNVICVAIQKHGFSMLDVYLKKFAVESIFDVKLYFKRCCPPLHEFVVDECMKEGQLVSRPFCLIKSGRRQGKGETLLLSDYSDNYYDIVRKALEDQRWRLVHLRIKETVVRPLFSGAQVRFLRIEPLVPMKQSRMVNCGSVVAVWIDATSKFVPRTILDGFPNLEVVMYNDCNFFRVVPPKKLSLYICRSDICTCEDAMFKIPKENMVLVKWRKPKNMATFRYAGPEYFLCLGTYERDSSQGF